MSPEVEKKGLKPAKVTTGFSHDESCLPTTLAYCGRMVVGSLVTLSRTEP